jgi:hypothetical protein
MQKLENRMQVIKDQEDLLGFHINAIKVPAFYLFRFNHFKTKNFISYYQYFISFNYIVLFLRKMLRF